MEKTLTTWFTNTECIGIVVGKDEVTGKKKAYIGSVCGRDEDCDEKHIMKNGSKITADQLQEILDELKR